MVPFPLLFLLTHLSPEYCHLGLILKPARLCMTELLLVCYPAMVTVLIRPSGVYLSYVHCAPGPGQGAPDTAVIKTDPQMLTYMKPIWSLKNTDFFLKLNIWHTI